MSYRGRVAPNRIDRPGTAEEAWDGWVELKRLPVADPLGWASAVIVAAHPDDEILGAGGTLARLVGHEEPDFLAEVWIRTERKPVSVAQSTGLA